MLIFSNWSFSTKVTGAFLLQENIYELTELKTFEPRKTEILREITWNYVKLREITVLLNLLVFICTNPSNSTFLFNLSKNEPSWKKSVYHINPASLFFGIKRAGSYAPIDTRCTRPSKGLAKNETTKNSRKGMILNNDFSVNEI